MDRLARIIVQHGRLAIPAEALDDDTDLFGGGMDSLAVVNVLMAIEATFGVEFPEAMLNRRSFATLGTLRAIIASLPAEVD